VTIFCEDREKASGWAKGMMASVFGAFQAFVREDSSLQNEFCAIHFENFIQAFLVTQGKLRSRTNGFLGPPG